MTKKILNQILSKPHFCFLLVAIPVGIFNIFTIPPLAGNDEISHFSRAYEITNGNIITSKMKKVNNFGGEIPKKALDLYTINYPFNPLSVDKKSISKEKEDAKKTSINTDVKSEVSYSGAALYSPVSYLPHVLSIFTAKLFNLSILSTIYLTRLFIFSISIILIFISIRIAPIKKWYLFVIGILPMTLILSSNISLDGLIIGISLFIVSILLNIYINKKDSLNIGTYKLGLLPILSIASIYFALTKPVYVFLLFINVFIFSTIIKPKSKKWLLWLTFTVLIPFTMMMGWNLFISSMNYDAGQRSSVNSVGIYPPTKEQAIEDVIKSPLRPIKILLFTFIDSYKEKQDIPNYILSSWSGKYTEYRLTPANWVTIVIIISLILSFVMKDKEKYKFTNPIKMYTALAIMIGLAGVVVSMFLYATSRGSNSINGIQGRYFIPFMPFIIFILSDNKSLIFKQNNKTKLFIISICLISIVIMIRLLYSSFI